MGTTPQQVTSLTEFLVVDRPLVYNIILGQPLLNVVQVVTSTYHLKMKFPTQHEKGMVKGDQAAAQNYYVMALKGKMKAKETLIVEDLDVRGEYPQISTVDEDITCIPLNGHQERCVQIRSCLPNTLRAKLSELLNEFINVFAWSTEDMPDIDPAIIEHRLQVNPNHRYVKQKKRSFSMERIKVIDEEVTKLVQANFVREVNYPEWLSNVVIVKKPNEKWLTCIDFTDLNKACPKDSFPLP
ncbi:uncharacterized protein LOC131160750 [Malania oleifera]|uniref:uncharacterized protein LOC131160750 n=1 Tax=Malania oleifera TaxID=397392 RepID=UPI0025AE79DB|nr:uncharacterized protein LOC131160750 [Malania oleifera]